MSAGEVQTVARAGWFTEQICHPEVLFAHARICWKITSPARTVLHITMEHTIPRRPLQCMPCMQASHHTIHWHGLSHSSFLPSFDVESATFIARHFLIRVQPFNLLARTLQAGF
eukprot:64185-Amphidinium_carterae.1